MWNLKDFKFKLTFSYLLVIFLSFGLISYFLDKNLEKHALQEVKSSLVKQASLIENQIGPKQFDQGDGAFFDRLVKTISPKINCRITIINAQGKVLADSEKPLAEALLMDNHGSRPEVQEAVRRGVGETIRYSATLKLNMLYVAYAVRTADEVSGIIRMALPLTYIEKMLFVTRRTILLSVFFALVLAYILGSYLNRGIVFPIKRIIYASRKFSEGDFSHRMLVNSHDEIGELARALNKMAQEIESRIQQTEVQNQQLKAIFQCMVEGIVVVDRAQHIISLNPTVEKIFRVTRQGSEGKFFLEVIPNNAIADIITEVLRASAFVSRELSLAWPVQKIFQIDASPIFEKVSVSGCLLVIHDITEIRRLETMRRDFVANVSHELKTPLTSIKGFIETLLEGALDDKENSRHFLEIIQNHTNRLDFLVNDLLALSYLESKEIQLDKREVNPKTVTDQILQGFTSQLKKKALETKNMLPADLVVRADKDKIEQVMTNLIDNAIKYNQQKGLITISSLIESGQVKIYVQDTGCGIPAKDAPRIFERFYRVDRARSRELGGTGLGLSIVKHIVELHGGTLGVESTEGFGSKFWFSLPR